MFFKVSAVKDPGGKMKEMTDVSSISMVAQAKMRYLQTQKQHLDQGLQQRVSTQSQQQQNVGPTTIENYDERVSKSSAPKKSAFQSEYEEEVNGRKKKDGAK